MTIVIKKKRKKRKKNKAKLNKSKPKPIFDENGWAPASGVKPEAFDLVDLRDAWGNIKKGWWNDSEGRFETALTIRKWNFLGTVAWRRISRSEGIEF